MKRSLLLSSVFLASAALLLNSCNKEQSPVSPKEPLPQASAESVALPGAPMTREFTVAQIRIHDYCRTVAFCENAQPLTIPDNDMFATLEQAKQLGQKVKATYDPWQARLIGVELLTAKKAIPSRVQGVAFNLEGMATEDLDDVGKLGVINTTSPGLTNVVPDFATAQLMFTYITKQCCAIPGPYGIDYCIPFQYAYDGCYARAHKMCWILNNKYHYGTHKIFSFANAGSDVLSVQGQKWGGCCINWWYHVAPLVNVNTPTGVKAYVFDPAMFDQPVLLSVWLHAQENPVCGAGANVSMINIQPTTSFWPSDYSGYSFDPDPTYAYTNYYLNYYGPMTTCP